MKINTRTFSNLAIRFVVLILFILPGNSVAQTKVQKIDALMDTYYQYGQFNGAVLVAEHGKVIYQKGFGLANMEWDIPNTPDTKFRLGSITKQFTAMLIMQFVEKGTLKLKGKISDYLPDYPKLQGDKVTLHHLLTHTSGIPNYTNLPDFKKEFNPHTPQEFMKRFINLDLEFEPGSKFKYSNSNYFILGVILEKVSGKPYETLLRENILTPLGMKNTGYDHSEPILKKRAAGYIKQGKYLNAAYLDMLIPLSAGALYSTVEDLTLWDQALYTEKLLSNKYKDIYFKPFLGNYAYGWGVRKVPIGTTKDSTHYMAHGGGINGFNSYIARLVDDKHLIVLLNNTGETRLEEMDLAIRNILYDQPYALPRHSLTDNLAEAIGKQGIDKALQQFRELKEKHPDEYYLDENEMNILGYQFLQQGKNREAIGIFILNAEAFPKSWNVYDSLGEAYLANGDKELAIRNYQKSIELNPQNTATRALEEA
jgi:CubicO group peptidase (beta-lactamase class C family)